VEICLVKDIQRTACLIFSAFFVGLSLKVGLKETSSAEMVPFFVRKKNVVAVFQSIYKMNYFFSDLEIFVAFFVGSSHEVGLKETSAAEMVPFFVRKKMWSRCSSSFTK